MTAQAANGRIYRTGVRDDLDGHAIPRRRVGRRPDLAHPPPTDDVVEEKGAESNSFACVAHQREGNHAGPLLV